jgi:hypothetical protein
MTSLKPSAHARNFKIAAEQRLAFAAMYVLSRINRYNLRYSVIPEGADRQCLESTIQVLFKDGLLDLDKDHFYVVTEVGKDRLRKYRQRYEEYLRIFDVYGHVDLGEGKFAFESYNLFSDDATWAKFLRDDRWEDLRVAVAMRKGLDPVEIVFMSFINEDRFFQNPEGKWEIGLLDGTNWDEIERIVNSALHAEDLAYQYPNPDFDTSQPESSANPRMIVVTAEDAIDEIILKGAQIVRSLLLPDEPNADQVVSASGATTTIIVEETVEESDEDDCDFVVVDPVAYYNPYFINPLYASPVWIEPVYPVVVAPGVVVVV